MTRFTASLMVLLATGPALADVIVLANRTGGPLPLRIAPASGAAQAVTLAPDEVGPVFTDGRASVTFTTRSGAKRYQLDANCAYYFGRTREGNVDMQKIGLGETPATATGRNLPSSASRALTATIPVRIFVDEEEPARPVHWQRRLQRRVEAASEILERFARVRLQVVGFGTWNSDNSTNDFYAGLAEFEREAKSGSARVAIGFSSQWELTRGRVHLAGTRGPLHSHIFVREGAPNVSEPEKLEFLLHELGHFMGAAHSPERNSVMRPVLGDDLAGRSDYRMQFDPVNALLVGMVGEEVQRRGVSQFFEMSPGTKLRLRQIYTQLAQAMPEDPAGNHYLQLLATASGTPVGEASKVLVQAISQAAVKNSMLPESASEGEQAKRTGDELSEYYVRQAAIAANKLPDDVRAKAFLLAIGVGMGGADFSNKLPPGAEAYVAAAESATDRTVRASVLGEPTVHGRRDWAQHFFLSAYLTAAVGETAANAAGLGKELVDAQGASGFSFADIAADRAGVQFAKAVLSKRVPLSIVAQAFSIQEFVPAFSELPEGLSASEFKSQYGSPANAKFRKMLAEINRRISKLPPYRVVEIDFNP